MHVHMRKHTLICVYANGCVSEHVHVPSPSLQGTILHIEINHAFSAKFRTFRDNRTKSVWGLGI